jgi:hypothetical protein
MNSAINAADGEQALKAFRSAISKCEKAREKLKPQSSAWKWVERQLGAYYVATSAIDDAMSNNKRADRHTTTDSESVAATLIMLIQKCEKLPDKFADVSPQQTLALRRLSAFRLALSLIQADGGK